MIFPSNRVRIMVATKPIDFRKGHDSLAAMVKNALRKDPFTGTVFVFRAKKADRLKLLYWDGTGLVMAYKRLEEHSFTWPAVKDGLMLMNHSRDRRQPARRVVGGHALAKLDIKARDLLGETGDLIQQEAREVAHRCRQHAVIVVDDGCKAPDMRRAGRGHDALLGQVRAQSIDRLRALPNQKIAGPVSHCRRLLRLALHGDEPHRRPRRRFCNRLGIGYVILLPFHERLHIGGRDQPHLVAEIADGPAPVMRAGTGLHRHHARRLRSNELQ
jgi:transposase